MNSCENGRLQSNRLEETDVRHFELCLVCQALSPASPPPHPRTAASALMKLRQFRVRNKNVCVRTSKKNICRFMSNIRTPYLKSDSNLCNKLMLFLSSALQMQDCFVRILFGNNFVCVCKKTVTRMCHAS